MREENLKKIGIGFLVFSIILVLIYFSYIFKDVIIMLVISILLAFIFNPLVTWLEHKNVRRSFSVLIVMISSLLLITVAFGTLIPKIINQIQALTNQITQQKVANALGGIEKQIHQLFPFVQSFDLVEKITAFLSSFLIDTVNNLSTIVSSIFNVIALVIIVPFMTYFLLKDNTQIIKSIINIMPNKYFEVSYWILKKVTIQLGRYVRAWILDALIVAILSSIGLTILGVENSITIGMIAGIGHLIPYFGPLIGGLPAIIIALLQFGDISILFSIIIMFLIIYTLDNGYVQPNLLSHGTDLHPLLIIILILLGNQALGILGMLLAVPTATVLRTAIKEIYYGYKNYRIIHIR